jgi:hypothetical protein
MIIIIPYVLQALVDLIKSPKFIRFESLIVYCSRQKQAEDIVKQLKHDLQSVSGSHRGTESVLSSRDINSMAKKRYFSGASTSSKKRKVEWSIGHYHGGMKPDERDKVHKDFMEGKIRIMVATEAFGVGINKKNIRAIIHYDMPKSIELYVQEAGRAGRDGQPAYCHTFIDEEVTTVARSIIGLYWNPYTGYHDNNIPNTETKGHLHMLFAIYFSGCISAMTLCILQCLYCNIIVLYVCSILCIISYNKYAPGVRAMTLILA